MSEFIVTIKRDGETTTCDPVEVKAAPGDSVQWVCHDGDVALDFGSTDPFTSKQVWRARRGDLTPVAIIASEPQGGKVFTPSISIDGTVVAESLGGLIIQP